ncbi:hypothetical protein HMPREF3150_02897 [Pseudomonas aeruginosa]|nr:hypothetical protein HMPREF3150_02897 [Pseudomonas aeruginosa]
MSKTLKKQAFPSPQETRRSARAVLASFLLSMARPDRSDRFAH